MSACVCVCVGYGWVSEDFRVNFGHGVEGGFLEERLERRAGHRGPGASVY